MDLKFLVKVTGHIGSAQLLVAGGGCHSHHY